MSDKVLSVEEVNAALKLAGASPTTRELNVAAVRVWWESGRNRADAADHIAALALGVLPEGWKWNPAMGRYEWAGGGYARKIYGQWCVCFRDWPEAVRGGQAEIAGRLLAAHVELERLRAGGVK